MTNYNENRSEFDEIFSELRYHPNEHLTHNRLLAYKNIPEYKGFVFEYNRSGSSAPFLRVNGKEIDRYELSCDLGFYDETGKHLDYKLPNFTIELFIVRKEPEYSDNLIIMGIDELAFYLNVQRNDEAKATFNFPSLSPCELSSDGFNYISEGRRILNSYFPTLQGPALDLYFEDELNEIFAVTTNALAFLYRIKERVFEETTLIKSHRYSSQFNMYPRFNNGISEVAGGLYSFWERIAFVFNEFFPLSQSSNRVPSYHQYFTKQAEKADISLKTASFNWFFDRLDNQHKRLGELRHPMIHYNKHSSPSGMRSAELIKQLHNNLDPAILQQTWAEELEFLKSELAILSTGLEKMLTVIEEWAIVSPRPLNNPV
ncbi:hypothetical protein F1649_19330 [Arcticibacter tournemirensis]|uniref:Uncharacterized protein n=1 Tax=Arcticibacter tournemirensis TaxID=699437 RepID=A0A5M9GSY2_9SPHI|nr:hypothetical protein [Arcticibacter tournemirensis]KAA8476831.1 hypothetical protein F1649_19330 [Arcticibacter tournemirensis]